MREQAYGCGDTEEMILDAKTWIPDTRYLILYKTEFTTGGKFRMITIPFK